MRCVKQFSAFRKIPGLFYSRKKAATTTILGQQGRRTHGAPSINVQDIYAENLFEKKRPTYSSTVSLDSGYCQQLVTDHEFHSHNSNVKFTGERVYLTRAVRVSTLPSLKSQSSQDFNILLTCGGPAQYKQFQILQCYSVTVAPSMAYGSPAPRQ